MSDYRDGNDGRSRDGQNRSSPRSGRPRSEDPLAELARLIDEDPFADFDRPQHAQEEPAGLVHEEDHPASEWSLDTSWPRYQPPSERSGGGDGDEAAPPHLAEDASEPAGDEAGAPGHHAVAADDAEDEQFRQSLEEQFRQIETPDRADAAAAPAPADYADDDHADDIEGVVEPPLAQAPGRQESQETEEPPYATSTEDAPARRFDPVSAVAAHLFADEPQRGDVRAATGEQRINPFVVRPPEPHEIVRPSRPAGEVHRETEAYPSLLESVPEGAADYPEPDRDFSDWRDDGHVGHGEAYAEPAYHEGHDGGQPHLSGDDRAYDVEGDFPPEIYQESARRPRRGLLIVTSLVGLVVVGGAVAMAYRGMSGDPSGEPPVIRADAAPTKVAAETDEPAAEEGQGKLVYERIGGIPTEREERLVSREEPVFEVEGRDGPTVPHESSGQAAAAEDLASTGASSEPRRVRTVVVRPDGTIIPPSEPARRQETARADADDARQGQAQQAQPNGEERAGTEDRVALAGPQEPEFVPPSAPQPASPVLRQAEQPPQADRPPQEEQPQQAEQPLQEEQTQQAEQPQPSGELRSGRPLQLVPGAGNSAASPTASRTETAALPGAAAEEPETRSAGQPFPSGDYVVQVSSTRNEQEARAAASSIAQAHGSLLGDYRMGVERADLGDRGVFYRVAAGSMAAQSDAIALCESLKSNGLECFVRRN